jgi:site-specific recombinase XerD
MSEIINQFKIYLRTKSLCTLTIRGYAFDVAQFIEWSEGNGILLNHVTTEDAIQYLNFLVTSRHEIRHGVVGIYSPRTVMKKIAAVRSFFDYLRACNEQ